MISISNILRDSKYNLSQFSDEKIQHLQESITLKPSKTGNLPYVTCLVRKKDIKLTPEEIVRQLYLMTLHEDLAIRLSGCKSSTLSPLDVKKSERISSSLIKTILHRYISW